MRPTSAGIEASMFLRGHRERDVDVVADALRRDLVDGRRDAHDRRERRALLAAAAPTQRPHTSTSDRQPPAMSRQAVPLRIVTSRPRHLPTRPSPARRARRSAAIASPAAAPDFGRLEAAHVDAVAAHLVVEDPLGGVEQARRLGAVAARRLQRVLDQVALVARRPRPSATRASPCPTSRRSAATAAGDGRE